MAVVIIITLAVAVAAVVSNHMIGIVAAAIMDGVRASLIIADFGFDVVDDVADNRTRYAGLPYSYSIVGVVVGPKGLSQDGSLNKDDVRRHGVRGSRVPRPPLHDKRTIRRTSVPCAAVLGVGGGVGGATQPLEFRPMPR